MDYFNLNLYLLWAFSTVPMLAVSFYGLFKCGLSPLDFIIVSVVSMIPIINTVVLVMLILFSLTGALKRNGCNQY